MAKKIFVGQKRSKRIPPIRIIVFSFLAMVLIGGGLLTLPFCSNNGTFTPVEDAMFTATSATCITGLSVYDTWNYWSPIGQVIILLLIQIGSLGLITFTSGFTLFLRQKLGLKDLALARESAGTDSVNVRHLLRTVFIFTFSMELIGALLLMIRFIPRQGLLGIWTSVFTAISAFCNAGFDIFNSMGADVATFTFANDPLVALTCTGLIVVGGLGFIVVSEIFLKKMWPRVKRDHTHRLSFHAQVVLVMTGVLLVAGTAAIMASEYNHSLKDYNFFEKIIVSFFHSACCRTAGFSAIDVSGLSTITKIISVILMFIGGSPSSTAGGIKTTTFLVLYATVFSVLRGRSGTFFLKRHIPTKTVFQALTIFICSIVIILITAIIMMVSVPHASAIDSLYEATSAFTTTGFNSAFTPYLNLLSKIALIVLMFIGRIGPISFGLFFVNKRGRHTESILPEGNLLVG